MKFRALALLFAAFTVCAGCGNGNQGLLRLDSQSSAMTQRAEELLRGDPSGPIAAPQVPGHVRDGADVFKSPVPEGELPYSIECLSPAVPVLAEDFEAAAVLYLMRDQPVYTLTALQQRLSASLKTGNEILQSHGYYAGSVAGHIEVPDDEEIARLRAQNQPISVQVRVLFEPGQQFVTGSSSVGELEPGLKPQPGRDVRETPVDFSDRAVNLPQGSPAVADDVLAAVDRVEEAYRNRGYPFAVIASTRFILDRSSQELEAEVYVKPGDFVRMGDLFLGDDPPVVLSYFEALRPWRPGRPWDERRVQFFRESLQQSGLFQSIDIKPGEVQHSDIAPEGELRYVQLDLVSAPERTVGGALKYDSDFGAGVQGFWEHRNFTGSADRLRLELPIWEDMQEFSANYRLPFLFGENQDFIAQAGLLNETTDAYEIQSAAAAAGVERRFSRRWRASVQASVQGGRLKDPDEPRRNFFMLGFPLSATYSTTNQLLNASNGFRVTASVAPYTGRYNGDFNALRTRVDGYAYFPLQGEDELVVAVRGSYGMVVGADAPDVPPSVRFYCGGGGSVRGYAYQSIGPRNKRNDPLGGSSLIEVSSELRWKVGENWGVVAFVDGGTTYDGSTPDVDSNLHWGAGLGLRYYTAIGPVRFDVGVPLNKRSDDDSFQFYISIGQSF